MTMPKASFPSNSIALKISTGHNSAGNGGDGYNYGNITNKPSIDFNPTNKADGADVKVNTGDHVYQKASWDAGGANAKAEDYSKKVEGGYAGGGAKIRRPRAAQRSSQNAKEFSRILAQQNV